MEKKIFFSLFFFLFEFTLLNAKKMLGNSKYKIISLCKILTSKKKSNLFRTKIHNFNFNSKIVFF